MATDKQKIAIVLGGAVNVFNEAEQIYTDYNIDYVIAVNNCIQDYPGHIDAAVSLHPTKIAEWLDRRKALNIPSHIVSFKQQDRRHTYDRVTDVIDYLWPEMKQSGSSGLYAVKVAFDLFNADKVILAGVPMDSGPHYHTNKNWGTPKDFREGWLQAMPYLKDKVKSLGGWTAEQLGLPTRDWANG